MEMDALLEAVITEPLEKIIEIFPNNLTNNKLFLDYEILNRSLEFGRLEIADYFLNNKCRVNRHDKEASCNNTPLHHAVILRDINLVTRILKKNGSVVAKNADGDTPLHLAFINQDIDIVDTIIEHIKTFKSESINNPKNKYGCSHMHIACVRNQVDLVKMYLDNGEDVGHAIYENSSVHAGFTPLHFAVKIGSECIDTIQLLLSRGAKPFLEDSSSISAYDINEDRVLDDSVIQYMLTESYKEKCLPLFHMACLEGNEDYMDRFLEMGVNVNRPLSKKLAFYSSYTPLHCAVLNGDPSRVKKLLVHGADINLCDGASMSPLHLALYTEKPSASRREDNVVDTLFTGLADPCLNKRDPHGLSYFHVAVTRNKVDLVRKYLERGYAHVDDKVQRNLRNFSNFTPLHFGVMYGCLEVVEVLLKAKASVNCNDDYVHGTPLHMAMEKGDLRMAHLLLDHGADVNARLQDTKRTPLHLLVLNVLKRPYQLVTENLFAVEDEGIEAMIRRLVILGCDINLQDIDGNTPLHIACSKIRIGSSCVKSLLRWGSNLDIENDNDKTPFENSFLDSYRCNAHDYMMLYHHVKKLHHLGLWIHENNIACCKRVLAEKDKCDPNNECFTEENLQHLQEMCIHEVEDLKATKLQLRTSLYHVIWDDMDSLKSRARTSRLQQILDAMKPMLDAENFDLKFPCYGSFVRLWYLLARKYAPEQDSDQAPITVKARRKPNTYKKCIPRKPVKIINNKKGVKPVNIKKVIKSVNISTREIENVNSNEKVENVNSNEKVENVKRNNEVDTVTSTTDIEHAE